VKLSIIVAQSRNGVIGIEGRLPWEGQLKADMIHFRKVTMGCPVIMGRRTFESIPVQFRPLPGRVNIVLSRDRSFQPLDCIVASSFAEAVSYCKSCLQGSNEVFVIGGTSVYAEALLNAERVYLTLVDADFLGDTYFPDLLEDEWVITEQSERYPADEHNDHPYQFVVFERRKS
jgi:dihydrofolate reductase